MQINSFNHFRAISIVIIIAGHSFGVVGMQPNSLIDITIMNVIKGGSNLFVFISGFLFYQVFYPKYQFQNFLKKKYYNVFVPYLILGFIPIALYVVLKKDNYDGYFLPNGMGVIDEYLVPALKYYASGRFLTAYWFIPFIMVTFVLSPLHMKYIQASLKFQLLIILVFSAISALVHRPPLNINVLQSVLYYTPVYLIGITASIHKEAIYKYLKGKELQLLAIVILLAVFQSSLGIVGNYHKPAFTYGGIDLMYFQELALCFFFMIWLNRFETYNNKIVHRIAATSFAAFFIHPFVLWFLGKLDFGYIKADSWVIFAIFAGTLSAFCILLAVLFRKVSPKYSKIIIGY